MERKLRDTRNITGIFGISLLILGILSLLFQYSTSVNNTAYAQVTGAGTSTPAVDLGPYIPIGPPYRSTSLDTDSNDTNVFVAYGVDDGVYGALIPGTQVKEHKRNQMDPPLLIEGGTDPALDVGGDKMIVTATSGGDIANVVCPPDDDDGCSPPQSVSTAPGIETSCFDDVNGDGDEYVMMQMTLTALPVFQMIKSLQQVSTAPHYNLLQQKQQKVMVVLFAQLKKGTNALTVQTTMVMG